MRHRGSEGMWLEVTEGGGEVWRAHARSSVTKTPGAFQCQIRHCLCFLCFISIIFALGHPRRKILSSFSKCGGGAQGGKVAAPKGWRQDLNPGLSDERTHLFLLHCVYFQVSYKMSLNVGFLFFVLHIPSRLNSFTQWLSIVSLASI